jgi:drug/metabolite transporter (DMT)-like permease
LLGPLLVGLGAMLWATDSVFRVASVQALDPVFIVFLEHLVATAVVFPLVWLRHRGEWLKLAGREWAALLLIGAGGSALATVLFTASFKYLNPSVTILLQKFQPLIVVLTAYLFLGERPNRRYFLWAPIALLAAIVLAFPDLDFRFLMGGIDPRSKGVIYALSAAGLWALSTTAGRALLKGRGFLVATFWRYAFGLGTLSALLIAGGQEKIAFGALVDRRELGLSILYMGLVPGLLAMLVYYAGLARTSASVATFLELLFPVSAVIINTLYLENSSLQPAQVAAAAVLLLSVLQVSRAGSQSA